MQVFDRRAARTVARILVVPAAVAAVGVAAPLAVAHTELDATSPAANAALAGLPPSVTLTFSDKMAKKYAKVAVTGPDGKPAATGEPDVRGKTVSLALKPVPAPGRYTVGYRVVSADGHPVAGSYVFTLKEATRPSPSAAAPASSSPSPATPAPGPERKAAKSSISGWALAGAALLALGAGVGVYAFRRRHARDGE
ncbi:copper resistance CopC family protein [Streptomyces sp. NBC_00687]|uniref:copper resistance CopC family protein n=1 Tax=Streptomyces sp. NBC_00687 TaxID=2975807 RepID=UPI00225A302E|nr:copper resistance CopC family protein [Streptomyces sp. NBC_00687]MCX4920029.1 copper resistance protein CopC [Streptomyces sp. NBC_00687]